VPKNMHRKYVPLDLSDAWVLEPTVNKKPRNAFGALALSEFENSCGRNFSVTQHFIERIQVELTARRAGQVTLTIQMEGVDRFITEAS
jgi:hypothetical protein